MGKILGYQKKKFLGLEEQISGSFGVKMICFTVKNDVKRAMSIIHYSFFPFTFPLFQCDFNVILLNLIRDLSEHE